MTYKYYPDRPQKLTKEFTEKEFAKLISRIENAERSDSPQDWIKLYGEWNALQAYLSGEASRISYAHSKDMNNKEWDLADKYFREEITNTTVRKSILEHLTRQLSPTISRSPRSSSLFPRWWNRGQAS